MKNILRAYSEDLADCRYAGILENLLNLLGPVKVLDASWEYDYQGDVDVSVLLKDGTVFSYHYYYGSCSGCDEWEDRALSNDEIQIVMQREATVFPDEDTWRLWDSGRNKEMR